MDIYAENILDHYRSPRNTEPVAHPSITHREENLSCGDTIDVALRIEEGRIVAIHWHGNGCAISQAGMSILSETLHGISVDEALARTTTWMQELLGVPVGPRRFKCAYLGLHTVQNALRRHAGMQPYGWHETMGDAV